MGSVAADSSVGAVLKSKLSDHLFDLEANAICTSVGCQEFNQVVLGRARWGDWARLYDEILFLARNGRG